MRTVSAARIIGTISRGVITIIAGAIAGLYVIAAVGFVVSVVVIIIVMVTSDGLR